MLHAFQLFQVADGDDAGCAEIQFRRDLLFLVLGLAFLLGLLVLLCELLLCCCVSFRFCSCCLRRRAFS